MPINNINHALTNTRTSMKIIPHHRPIRRPQNPPLTRRQLDQVVGEAVTRHLHLDARTHYEDAAAQSLIEDVLAMLPPQPDY